MIRAIYLIPEGTRIDTLTPEQQQAIQSVNSQWRLPMPGTIPHDGLEVVDGLTDDNFDPLVMPALGLDWQCIGMWQWSGSGELVTLVPLDMDALYPHLPPTPEYDEEGNVVGTVPAEPRVPHSWAGWPSIPVGNPE